MINQQPPCSCMIVHVVRNEQRCYNNHELDCCILHVLTSANNPYRFAKLYNNMLKHDWTLILLFYQSCTIMLTVLLQGCWANYPVIACDIFTRVYNNGSYLLWNAINILSFGNKEIPNGFPCLDTLIQTRGMLRDLRKAVKKHEPLSKCF